MLRIPEFRMLIDAPLEYGMATSGGIPLIGPTHGQFGLGVTLQQPGDDPTGDLRSTYELMAAVGPVGEHGGTMINRRGDPETPFLGAIRDPNTDRLFLLIPFNHAKLTENQLRQECGRLIEWIRFATPAMEQWEVVLKGATLLAIDTYQRGIGSSDGYSAEERYAFRTDGMFEWVKNIHISVGGGGLSASRTSRERLTGSWDILNVNGDPVLRLDNSEGKRSVLTLQRRGAEVLLEGRRFLAEKRRA